LEHNTDDPVYALFIKNPYWNKDNQEVPSGESMVNSADGPGFALFMKNPYWKKFYKEAPSERVKEHLRGVFEYSGAVIENRDTSNISHTGVFHELTIDDLEYLMKNTTGMERLFYQKRIQALQNKI